jgi:hypothetical protein
MVKLVNPAAEAVTAKLQLRGKLKLGSDVSRTTLAGPAGAVNSAESEPIRPVTSTLPAAETMTLELPPTSVEVLRVKVK